MSASLTRVPFRGDELLALQDDDGVWVSVRRVCEMLGVDPANQRRKLQDPDEDWRWCAITSPSQGGPQQTFMLHLDHLPAWLMGIATKRVREDLRPKLRLYKREARDVLAAHFVRRERHSHAERTKELFLLATPVRRPSLYADTWRSLEALYIGDDAQRLVRPRRCFRGVVHALRVRFVGGDVATELRVRNPEPAKRRDYDFYADTVFDGLRDEHLKTVALLASLAFERYPTSPRLRRERFWADVNAFTNYRPQLGEPDPTDPRQLALFDVGPSNDQGVA